MFLINFFSSSELFGKYLFVVDVDGFWIAAICWAVGLVVAVPYLANAPQPTPHWSVNDQRNRHRR